MSTTILDGVTFKNMLIGGAEFIKINSATINDLNVFPVPDGDTGTNMTKTIEGGISHIINDGGQTADDDRSEEVCRCVANAVHKHPKRARKKHWQALLVAFCLRLNNMGTAQNKQRQKSDRSDENTVKQKCAPLFTGSVALLHLDREQRCTVANTAKECPYPERESPSLFFFRLGFLFHIK